MRETHVLVVDDEPGLAGALCRALDLLAGGACVTESVSSADMALARLAETHFDVLVTDLCLPGTDGLTLIRQARQMQAQAGLRTVLITAYPTVRGETAGVELVDAYLPKPFSLGMFIHVVRCLLDQAPECGP